MTNDPVTSTTHKGHDHTNDQVLTAQPAGGVTVPNGRRCKATLKKGDGMCVVTGGHEPRRLRQVRGRRRGGGGGSGRGHLEKLGDSVTLP